MSTRRTPRGRRHYVVDGHIENLGLYNRSIVGTWNHDNVKGDFKITRQ